jgi:glyoxylase-like metal-dependent hydrolase (beta-lactamase superfamily II)
VLETHVHADHVSRAKVLADETGAALLLPVQKRVHFPFTPVRDGDTIAVGSARLVARRTPGHTDESTTYLLGDAGAFTGDTLFVRGVGRPDLHADSAEATRRARDLFASLQTLRALPADTLVLPAHTSEAVPFDHRPVVARIRDIDTWLSDWMTSEPTFIERLLARVPPTPPNFSTIVSLNEAGEQPTGDPTDLEAGANRCAIA